MNENDVWFAKYNNDFESTRSGPCGLAKQKETSKYAAGPGNANLQNRLLELTDHRPKLMGRRCFIYVCLALFSERFGDSYYFLPESLGTDRRNYSVNLESGAIT